MKTWLILIYGILIITTPISKADSGSPSEYETTRKEIEILYKQLANLNQQEKSEREKCSKDLTLSYQEKENEFKSKMIVKDFELKKQINQAETLANQLSESQSKLKEAEDILTTTKEQIKELESKNLELEQIKAKLTEKLSYNNKTITDMSLKFKESQAQLEKENNSLQILKDGNKTLSEHLASANSSLSLAVEKNSELQNKNGSLTNKAETLEKDLKTNKDELSILSQLKDSCKKELTSTQEELKFNSTCQMKENVELQTETQKKENGPSAADQNNLISIVGSHGPLNSINVSNGNKSSLVEVEKGFSAGIQYQRKLTHKVWGLTGVNLNGEFNLGVGYSF